MAIDLEIKHMPKKTKTANSLTNREVLVKDSTRANVLAQETHAELVVITVLQKDATKGDKTLKRKSM